MQEVVKGFAINEMKKKSLEIVKSKFLVFHLNIVDLRAYK